MKMEFRDLKRQYEVLGPDIDEAVREVCASGAYIHGPAVESLEKELASYVGVKHCICCGNGTDALFIALKVWGIGPGDAVFVPNFTFFASAEVVSAVGATPVFVEVDPQTFSISAEDLAGKIESVLAEGALTPRVVTIVDLFGLPGYSPKIRETASLHGMKILEDGAQGFGGSIDGKRNCSFGDISTTSFFPAKPLGCYGDGGAIFTDNDEWDALARSYCVHGKGSFKYDNVRIGVNSRLDTIQAAILSVKLNAFEDYELDLVAQAAQRYDSALQSLSCEGVLERPFIPEKFHSSWAQYTIKLRDEASRDSLQSFLRDEGIPSMVYYPKTMHRQEAFSYIKKYGDCPCAEELSHRVLSLPMGPYIKPSEIDQVASAITRWAAGNAG